MARSASLAFILLTTTAAAAFAQVGGVYIDAKGMLRQVSRLAQDERLAALQAEAVGKPSSTQLADGSSLRKVSLRRLERLAAAAHKAGKPLPADVRFLAGMTRLQYVFIDPAGDDVILAGPAEGWKQLPTGEVVGAKSGRPVLHLDDLVVALRYAFTEKARPSFIGCSIDPTPEGLRSYAAHLRRIGRIDRTRLRETFAGMERAMGPQAVSLYGVDGSSRFALMLVAADYRLKRLSMGHDPSPVKGVVNYLDLAARRGVPRVQPQHRWWFNAEYDAIRHTPDELAFELVGQGVKVATERADLSTKKSPNASRKGALSRNERRQSHVAPAARQLTESLTKHFPELAAKVPVFAELQNAIALSVAAELIARRHFGDESVKPDRGWKPSHFLDAQSCPLTKYEVPKTVPSIASWRLVRGRRWLISVSGGVQIAPTQLVERTPKKTARGTALAETRRGLKRPAAKTRWWWD
jgi:Protein of unknown function (DUF1598)